MAHLNPHLGLIERLYWLIRLRWIAVAGVVLTVFFTDRLLNIPVPVLPLYAIAASLGIYNSLFLIYLDRKGKKALAGHPVLLSSVANVQISLDLLSLLVLIHFSGGIENPFIFYFIFHMIIASTLLSRRASFLQATFSAVLLSSCAILEYLGHLNHYQLRGFVTESLHDNLIYVAGVLFVFISTLYIAVYMATSISSRLRERERSLREANRLLGEKDRLKSEYVLRVTHDIKEHLAAIQSCIEPVTAGIAGPLNQKQIDLLQRADRRSGKLLFFVKSLLEITQIKLSRQISMEYFSVMDCIKNAIANVGARARNKNIAVSSCIEPTVDKIRGVGPYIEETVSNLLANSVKYTPDNGRIDVEVSDKGNSILIEVKDTGIGIPGDELQKVFEEFYRASNAREIERDGTGLGLSIAKQVVERHQGKIWVESEEGKGSVFKIMLPKQFF